MAALQDTPAPNAPAAPTFKPGELALSAEGRRFIYDHERMGSFSRRLYWPKGASGVTLGAGFDMGELSAKAVADDLIAIGVEPEIAHRASMGAHLHGEAARIFAHANHGLITLTAAQEVALMEWILPHYVTMTRGALTRRLTQAQFDALVSYAYNPGYAKAWRTVMRDVNAGDDDGALAMIAKQTTSKHNVVASLVQRRADEIRLYRTGDYGKPKP